MSDRTIVQLTRRSKADYPTRSRPIPCICPYLFPLGDGAPFITGNPDVATVAAADQLRVTLAPAKAHAITMVDPQTPSKKPVDLRMDSSRRSQPVAKRVERSDDHACRPDAPPHNSPNEEPWPGCPLLAWHGNSGRSIDVQHERIECIRLIWRGKKAVSSNCRSLTPTLTPDVPISSSPQRRWRINYSADHRVVKGRRAK